MVPEAFRITSALRKIIENTLWLFMLRIVRIVLALFVGVWMARYLGPARFGTLNYAIAFTGLFIPLARLGLEGIAVRDIVREPDAADEILGTVFMLRLAGSILCLALVVVSLGMIRPEDTATLTIAAVISFGLVFHSFETIDCWFQSQVQSRYTVYAKTAALLLASAAKVTCILRGYGLHAFAWIIAGEVIVGAAGLAVVYRMRGLSLSSWRPLLSRARNLLGQSWPMIFSSTMAVIYVKIDQVMLRELIGDREVGIYATAVRISEVWYFVPFAVTTSVFPSLIKSRERGREFYEARMQQLQDFLVWIALAVALLMTFTAGPLISFLYGVEYAGAGPVLSIHIWAGIFVFLKVGTERWLVSESLFKFIMLNNVVGAGLNVLLNLYLIPRHGCVGAAVATVISYGAAGYLASFIHPKTRTAARIMTRALLVPFRFLAALSRRGDG